MTTTRTVEHSEYAKFARRVLRAYGRRMAAADVEDLADLVALRAEVDAAIQAGVDAIRADGRSWAAVARATGTTRQAAQMRYGR